MIGFIVRRLGHAVIVVFGVTIIVFVIIHMLPGGAARAILGIHASPQQLHAFMIANWYNRPLYEQYWHYISNLVQGNLGYSYHYNETVSALLSQNLPKSAVLVGAAYLVAILVAVPVGFLQALRRNRLVDHTLTTVAFVGYSMPIFWLGIILISIFSVTLHVFPPEAPQGSTIGAVLADPSGLVLPVATLAIVTIALFSRFVRSSAIEQLIQDYVRTARAQGASKRIIVTRHLLRNAAGPVITLVGLSIPATLSGAVVTETVFNYPGMGLLFWTAATTRDYPIMLGFTIVIAAATAIGSLLADVLYAVMDPRIRVS